MSFLKHARAKLTGDTYRDLSRLRSQLHVSPGVVYLFLPSELCLENVAEVINDLFDCPVSCCSTASGLYLGEFEDKGFVALSLDSEVCKAKTFFIEDMSDVDKLEAICTLITKYVLSSPNRQDLLSTFLADGLSRQEEMLIHLLSSALSGIPVVGGSSSDALKFESTPIYYQGKFYQNAAILFVLELSIDFKVFKVEHFYPTNQRMVITKADSEKRIIYEIDGEPAAERYANLIGRPKDELTVKDFSSHPLALSASGQNYIRSVDTFRGDSFLYTYGAVHEGVVFRVAQSEDIDNSTLKGLDEARLEFEEIYGSLGFECMLRKQELLHYNDKNILKNILKYYEQYQLVGCHTYGEQFLGHHVNQSLVGVIFGRKHEAKRS